MRKYERRAMEANHVRITVFIHIYSKENVNALFTSDVSVVYHNHSTSQKLFSKRYAY